MKLRRCRSAFALCLLAGVPAGAQDVRLRAPHPEWDECQSRFVAAIGSDAFRFSPQHGEGLGSVRLFAVLSHQRAAHFGDHGAALWRLSIRDAAGRRVLAVHGRAAIDDASGLALAEHHWDGRDDRGRTVADGTYRYTFEARFLPRRLEAAVPALAGASRYEDLASAAGVEEAFASTDQVVLDGAMAPAEARGLRASSRAACAVHQNTPLQAGFPYNFYYGSTHSHSNFSDGGYPTTACASGNAYGSGTFGPAAVYDLARNAARLDFWVINEHNHLIDDALANNAPPVTEAKVRQRYQEGRAAADAATVNGSFVGLYGMEWGVSTNNDQGHVTLIETPALFGWETCTGCSGAAPECTPGTNCYFDVFTPKRNNYLTLYQRSVQNPSPAGPLGILAHPGTGNFDNYALNADADAALQGIAVRSGLAFSTAESCGDGNVGQTDYTVFWLAALAKGFHLGPVADHDSHCNNYGLALPTRTVYLLPNAASPVLTKAALLQAHRARRFFASEDPNAQLVFGTADGAQVMGAIFSTGGSVTLRGAAYDPDGEAVQTIELWRGQIGAAAPTAPYRTFPSQSSFTLTETASGVSYFYFVRVVQADGHDLWSSPLWVTFGTGGGGGTAVYDASLRAPKCAAAGPSCDSGALLNGRAGLGPESNAPNTVNASCADGTSGTYHVDESVDRIKVSTVDGSTMAAGKAVRVEAMVWAYSSPSSDKLDLYYAANAASPAWTFLATLTPPAAGAQTLSATYTLPAGALQAVRARFRYNGSAAACGTGSYDDHDDMAFAVNGGGGPAPVTVFQDGAESASSTFVRTSTATTTQWTRNTSGPYAGAWSWRAGSATGGTYGVNGDARLTTPTLSFAGATTVTLTYAFKHRTESGYDFFEVRVSTDGGTTWTVLSTASGQSAGYSGWAPLRTVSLNAYAGRTNVKVQFRLVTDYSVNDWGAAVDEVKIVTQ